MHIPPCPHPHCPNSTEEWRPVKRYESYYEVSNCGRVRSLDRIETFPHPRWGTLYQRYVKGRLLRLHYIGTYFDIMLCARGEKRSYLVHHLVAYAFIGQGEPWQQCNHKGKDGDKLNNHANNLEWVTPSENKLHSIYVLGKHVWNRMPIDIPHIFSMHNAGMSLRKIAQTLHHSTDVVARVLHGTHWQQRENQSLLPTHCFKPHSQKGQTPPNRKLLDFEEVNRLLSQNMPLYKIAKQLGVSRGTLYTALRGEHWTQKI